MKRTPFVYERLPQLNALIEGITNQGENDYSRGVYLFAPIGVGKTTFLRKGLAPAALERGFEPLLVEMFPDAATDPRERLETAIVNALRESDALIETPMGAYRMDRLDGERMTLQDDANWTMLPPDVSLVDALSSLKATIGRPLLMMIDDADHLLSSASGLETLKVLQSSRDKLVDSNGEQGLYLVFTVNSLDRLRQFTSSKDLPFGDCPIAPELTFPPEDFGWRFTEHINSRLSADNQFQPKDIIRLFEIVGRRPNLLWEAVRKVGLDAGRAPELGSLLDQGLTVHPAGERFATRETYRTLTPLQRAILLSMMYDVHRGANGDHFSEQSRIRIARMSGISLLSDAALDESINELNEMGFIWREATSGVCGVESAVIAELARHGAINKTVAVEAIWAKYVNVGADEESRELLGSIDEGLPLN